MRKLLSYIIALGSVVIVAASAGAREYTLSEIYHQALQTSEKIEMAKENVFSAKMGKHKALSLLIPRLTAYGGYNWFTEDKYTSSGILIQPEESSSWGVRAD